MALDQLDALETRIGDLVKVVQELKRANTALTKELTIVREKLAREEERNQRWEEERAHITSRIEKVIDDIALVEYVAPQEMMSN